MTRQGCIKKSICCTFFFPPSLPESWIFVGTSQTLHRSLQRTLVPPSLLYSLWFCKQSCKTQSSKMGDLLANAHQVSHLWSATRQDKMNQSFTEHFCTWRRLHRDWLWLCRAHQPLTQNWGCLLVFGPGWSLLWLPECHLQASRKVAQSEGSRMKSFFQ